MAESAPQPIIIKKINKGHAGAHGGAWKIAYADFVTAMMAFFLLLWLLNSVTQEQLEGISNYFAPVTASSSTSGSGDILGGKTITEEGASQNTTSRDSVTVDLPPPKAGTGGEESTETQAEGEGQGTADASAEDLEKVEQEQFEEAKEELEETIAGIPAMRQYAESLMVDNTPEGLRIQIVDQDGLAMFPSGTADLYNHTKKLLEVVAKVVDQLPQKISVSGHTDSVPFASGIDYDNFDLSTDRANSARRFLVSPRRLSEDRISHIVGKAATEPLLRDDPKNARNRRLSIVLLKGTGERNPAQILDMPTPVQQKEEVLPGLGEIKRQQIQNGTAPALPQSNISVDDGASESGPSIGSGGISLELQPAIDAQ
jgi:chemotaxis protein MotB